MSWTLMLLVKTQKASLNSQTLKRERSSEWELWMFAGRAFVSSPVLHWSITVPFYIEEYLQMR